MKKKIFLISGVLLVVISTLIAFNFKEFKTTKKIVSYNGNNLLISIDGTTTSSLPTEGYYYLTNYKCDGANTKVAWDTKNYELSISNGTNDEAIFCNIDFSSKPSLYEMPVGSYVDYNGVGGNIGDTAVSCNKGDKESVLDEIEAINACSGENAREDTDTSDYTYGYCYSSENKFYETGWRIAYTDNNKTVIISAGSPECIARNESNNNENFIEKANARALKYCNKDFVDGDCVCDSSIDGQCLEASTDAWAMNAKDFYNITKAISGNGKRLSKDDGSELGVTTGTFGLEYCYNQYGNLECGYNNDLIDNGGYYWFASRYALSSNAGIYYSPIFRGVTGTEDENSNIKTDSLGLRPMISLSTTVYVTGGTGTKDDPYKIAN